MQLAKNVIDVGLSTNNLEPMLRFWRLDAAVRLYPDASHGAQLQHAELFLEHARLFLNG